MHIKELTIFSSSSWQEITQSIYHQNVELFLLHRKFVIRQSPGDSFSQHTLVVLWSTLVEMTSRITTMITKSNPCLTLSHSHLSVGIFYSSSGSVKLVCSCCWHFTALITVFSHNPPRYFVPMFVIQFICIFALHLTLICYSLCSLGGLYVCFVWCICLICTPSYPTTFFLPCIIIYLSVLVQISKVPKNIRAFVITVGCCSRVGDWL